MHHTLYTIQASRGVCAARNNRSAQPVTQHHHRFVADPIPTESTAVVAAPPLPSAHIQHLEPLTIDMLTAATPTERKYMLGMRLYPRVAAQNSTLAMKITGMLLELDDQDVLYLFDTPDALTERVHEAEDVLREHAKSIAKQKANGESANDAQAGPVTQNGRADDSTGQSINANCASSANSSKAPNDVASTVGTAGTKVTDEPEATEKSL